MTDDRYSQVEMGGLHSPGLPPPDGSCLPLRSSLHGDKDVSLLPCDWPWRTTFLNKADGFLMMDDPLVDLTPPGVQGVPF